MTAQRKMLASRMSEAQAIEGAKRGNGKCFEFLYSIHKKRVFSLCLRMTGNIAEAEDLTQDAFLQLHRKIETFRGDAAFSTWLQHLAVNVVLMHLRKKRLPEVALDESLDPNEEHGPKKDFGSQDQILAGSIDRVNLERAIEKLPRADRGIVVLHDIEGFEHNEIAQMTGCSIGSSKLQLVNARMKLRGLLKATRVKKTRLKKMKKTQCVTRLFQS